MVVRKRKKKHRLRGNRTHGKGNTKNKRGAGCRGGRGRAGSHKHKYSKYYMTFGVKKRLKPKEVERGINIKELEAGAETLAGKGKIKIDGKKLMVDGRVFPFAKILSLGTPSYQIQVKNVKVSSGAREKILKAGGSVEEEKEVEGSEE